ncbi:MAG: DUF1844 domain-containing protein [Candidatus Krumholzibacteriota bacterium]|nr:DUF1844 domain-containing protein [Candidatus Krumholzibacteriota bacterium]
MDNNSNHDETRKSYLFQHLVAMFQTLALQQLGKLANPISGELERDLHQAKITIDMLVMIQEKTAGNLSDNEKRVLDGVLMDLQMNYVDEINRGDYDQPPKAEQSAGPESKEPGPGGKSDKPPAAGDQPGKKEGK